MDITLIFAECRGTIALNGDLPVHLPEDLKFFKKYTMNKVVVMGRKTVESLPKKLKDRTIICLTSDKDYENEKCDIVMTSIEEIYDHVTDLGVDELVIAGGKTVYDQFMEDCNKIVKTRINHTLIPKKSFDKIKDKLPSPNMGVKGPFDSADVLEKTNKMVVIEYVWEDGGMNDETLDAYFHDAAGGVLDREL